MSAYRIKLRKKKSERTLVIDQWVEVKRVDGVTRTIKFPDDEELKAKLIERAEQKGRPVELVYRRLNFVNGVPKEYDWATDSVRIRQFGGRAVQRLRVVDWLKQLDFEPDGHLKFCVYTMPRPESRGGCDCEACRGFAERIRKYGY